MTTFAEHLDLRTIPEPNSGCLLWTGWTHHEGYGAFRSGGGNKYKFAHRASWEHHHGPIPAGMVVCHKCDVRSCVNPAHLFLGTVAENNADMDSKGRRGSVPGERHPRARLTAADVIAIRSDDRYQRVIAAQYGVAACTISEIKSRKKWRHI